MSQIRRQPCERPTEANPPRQLDAYQHLDGELWFAKRLGDFGFDVVFGGDTPEARRGRIRDALKLQGLELAIAGKLDGKTVTFEQAFERLYGEKL